MGLLIKSMGRAFGTALFVMLVSSGCLGFLALPAVGTQFGPLICTEGESMTYETYHYSSGGESGTNVEYYCDDEDGAPREVGFFELLLPGAAVLYGFIFLLVWPWSTVASWQKARKRQRLQQVGVTAVARILEVTQTNVRINNRPVVSLLLEIHPEDRSPYQITKRFPISELAISRLQPDSALMATVDPDDPENIDLPFEALNKLSRAAMPSGSSSVEKLKALKAMLDQGLITRQEYEDKKNDILANL